MRKYIIITCLLISFAVIADNTFNEYGVWHAIESTTLTAGQRTSAGPIDLSLSEKYYAFLVYGLATDSIYPKLDVYGMMTFTKADTVKGVLISSSTSYTADSTMVLADSLVDNETFPFLFIQLTNIHPDSTAVFDVYGFSRPTPRTVLRVR